MTSTDFILTSAEHSNKRDGVQIYNNMYDKMEIPYWTKNIKSCSTVTAKLQLKEMEKISQLSVQKNSTNETASSAHLHVLLCQLSKLAPREFLDRQISARKFD